ncbi:protein Shroom1 isoform 2-T2 [Mantella aurantiaca]
MSSISNAIDEWSTRSTSGISALRHQLISGDFPDRLTPVNAMAAIVDSAYSSFSGSSYVADYQTSFKHDICHLNNEQLSYMDSEYVKAIYNPSVIEYNHLQQHLHCDDSKEDANNGPGDHLSHKTKRSPTSNSSLCLPEHKISRNQGHSPPWVRNSVHNKLSQPCVVSVNMEEGSYQPHLPSSKFLDPSKDRMALKEVSSTCNENYHGSQTDESNKDCFQGIDSHTGKPFSVEIEEHAHKNRFDSAVDNPQKEGKTSKSTRRSWNEFVSVKLRGYKKKAGSWKPAKETNCCEGTKSEVEKLALNQQQKEQYHQNIKDMEFDNLEKCEIKYKHPHIKTSQTVYSEHSDDLCELPLKLLNCDDLHDIPKAHNLRKDATIKPIPLLSQKQEARPQISNCCDLPSEKITKALTPMLYHLAGGNNSSLAMMNTSQQTRPLDTNEECDAFQNKGHFAEPQVAEPQQPLHKTKSQLQLDENFENEFNDCDTTGGLTCSAEESFMLDYREKLKIAQKKVLRATSFKRRDLQMSLPIRLKLNPPKRSLVDHIRSYSLSSQNEEAKLAQPNISVDKGHKKDEPEKATVLRIGGRKRLTKEQRKLCYSEPEKLDHLGIHNSGLAWNSDGSVQNKSGDHYRMKSLDKERTLSSSNVSKIELKQIQHNALVEYMERKANRRPSSIHQSHVQKTGGTQSSPEWKTNETLCSDENLIHHHRRSTGASSSYDATVTWNDRYLKMSTLGEQTRSADTMGETTSYFDQCTLDNSKGYSNESSTSGYQERIKNSVGHIFTSGQQCNDDDSKISLEPSDEALPGNGNEVSDDVNDLYEGSAVGESPYLNAEDRDTEAVSKRIKSTDFQSMSSIQQEDLDLSGQVITQKASSEGYDDHSWNNGLTRQEMDSMQERRDSATEDLTGPRLKTSAEERCAELVREIVSKDKSLVDILKSFPGRAPAISLMKSLFHVDISLLEKCQNWRLQKDKINVEGMSKSHSKTMLLLQRMSDECLNEITSKKVELISIINSQLEELFAQRESLLAEISDNTTQGTNLEVVVKEVCKPNEYERYMMFIGDLEKVVSLLFCLTTRLARVENALSRTDENTDTDEMQSLKERHSLLSRQSEDAKDLKDNLDRREQVVTGILAKYLSEGQLEDYKHYVRLKTYFLIEQKDLEEKIKFHEEQLESLHNSIPP